MGIDDVYNWLRNRRGWYSVHEIAIGVGISDGSVNRNLRTLDKRGEVSWKQDTYKAAVYYWKAIK